MVHHQAFYFKEGTYSNDSFDEDPGGDWLVAGGEMVGRKTYQHRGTTLNPDTSQMGNARVWTTTGNETFEFRIFFENLTAEELGLLLFSVDLEIPGDKTILRQHYGYGKPAGFGSVRLAVKAELFPRNRYQPEFQPKELEKNKLEAIKLNFLGKVATEIAVWKAIKAWFSWPARPRADISYPSYQEFDRGLV